MAVTEADETMDYLVALAPHIWAIAIVFYGIGDLVTTLVGLPLEPTAEVGPLAASLYEQYGPGSMVLLKAAVFVGAYLLWRLVPSPQRIGVPLGLSALGVLVTIWNSSIIYAVYM